MNRNSILKLSLSCLIAMSGIGTTQAQLYEGFKNPTTNEVRPRVWWHWMNGNITKDGIYKDLMWMHNSGIGGAQSFDAGLTTPQIVKQRLIYMTPEWKDAFQYATHLTDSLGMELATAASPGWSQSGGPWVKPKDGMKKLVWRELRVNGGKSVKMAMPAPFTTSSAFQNIPTQNEAFTAESPAASEYYEDIAVLACRLSDDDLSMKEMNPKITASNGTFTLEQLSNTDLNDFAPLEIDKTSGVSYLTFDFGKPQLIRGISLTSDMIASQTTASSARELEASNDNISYHKVVDVPAGGVNEQTITFPAVTARYFRVAFHKPGADPLAAFGGTTGNSNAPIITKISELVFLTSPYINRSETKAGFCPDASLQSYVTPDEKGITEVINITDKMDANGNLDWNAPKGKWKILRFGFALTGKKNHPASPEATGLEVDKMDAQAVSDYMNYYLDMYKDATGNKLGKGGMEYIVTDSYEAQQNTWTKLLPEEFEKRCGYALLPWLPVLTGQIVKNTTESEQFLWDWRKTIGDLVVENYYENLNGILAARGMKRYSESHENGRVYMPDGMDVKKKADIPMSAMWVPTAGFGGVNNINAQADIRESASVSHIYGQKFVAAESLTTVGMLQNAWAYCPENLKPTADLEFASGLNRIVVHTSVHQPVDDKVPGLGLMIFGQWFNRHDTWSGQAKAWTDYLARTSYMMQQGQFVADVAYYYGEDNNITGLFGETPPAVPKGYNFDYVSSDALRNVLQADNDHVTSSKTGMTYRLLALDKNCNRMSIAVLRKLDELSKAGVQICGERPTQKAELNGSEEEFNRLINEIWSRPNVHAGQTMEQVLASLNVRPDFSYQSNDNADLLFVHHNTDKGGFYWVNNRNDQKEDVTLSFRITGKKPEIWHPETGVKEPASYTIANDRTQVTTTLTPNDAIFVVFEEAATENSVTIPAKSNTELLTISTPWNVKFQEHRGAPAEATFNTLASFTENSNEGIKYFSGVATYTNSFKLDKKALKNGGQILLDLGSVKNLAEVTVNGQNLGVIWKTPFCIDITSAVKKGINNLEVKVVNMWPNRLIGDAQPNVKEKITYTTMPFYKPTTALLPSGLLGPVKVVSEK